MRALRKIGTGLGWGVALAYATVFALLGYPYRPVT
jgi:hypothetical protein